MPRTQLTPELITAAIAGYEVQKAKIDDKIAELRAMLPGGNTVDARPHGKRVLSAAARARMAEAQRKRWAAVKGESCRRLRPELRTEAAAERGGPTADHRGNEKAVGGAESRKGTAG